MSTHSPGTGGGPAMRGFLHDKAVAEHRLARDTLRRVLTFARPYRAQLAFFSRTRTGALVQRLNGDVLGAQQAFTSTLQTVVSNGLTIAFTLAAMLAMSWRLTLLSLVLLPAFVLPARWFGRRLAALTRESYDLNAEAGQLMNERFNVAGAHLA